MKACPQCALEFSGGETFCPVDGARLVAFARPELGNGSGLPHDPLLNQTLAGRYRILRKIGEGGMGIVYEAVHVVIEKRVALKVLREDFSHRPDLVERFRQETGLKVGDPAQAMELGIFRRELDRLLDRG